MNNFNKITAENEPEPSLCTDTKMQSICQVIGCKKWNINSQVEDKAATMSNAIFLVSPYSWVASKNVIPEYTSIIFFILNIIFADIISYFTI